MAEGSVTTHTAQERRVAPELPKAPTLPSSPSGEPKTAQRRPRGHLSTEFALKGAELSHCLKGAGSSEAAGQFQHTAHLREHTSPSGAPQTTLDIRISHGGGSREGRTMWSLVSTAVYELEQKPSCRTHFDLSWWPHGEFLSVTP